MKKSTQIKVIASVLALLIAASFCLISCNDTGNNADTGDISEADIGTNTSAASDSENNADTEPSYESETGIDTSAETDSETSGADTSADVKKLRVPYVDGIALKSKTITVFAPLFSFLCNIEAAPYIENAPSFNINADLPLHEQICDEGSGLSWARYIINTTADEISSLIVLCEGAHEDGITISDNGKKEAEGLLGTAEAFAANAGYSSLEDCLASNYGSSLTVGDVKEYYEMTVLAVEYYETLETKLLSSITDAEIETYFNEKMQPAEKDRSLTRNAAIVTFSAKNGEKSEDYKQNIRKFTEEYLGGEQTADAFINLGKKYVSKYDVNLFRDLDRDFNADDIGKWLFSEERQIGDIETVTDSTGEYDYVCLYLGEGSEVWYANARLLLLCEKIEKWSITAPETYSVTPIEEVLSETEKF